MNKKAIWAIIGLMSAAVIGVVWLQMDLIRTSIRVNEEKFDERVFSALYRVVERLERQERIEVFEFSMNGYVASFMQEESGHLRPNDFPFNNLEGMETLTLQELESRLYAELANSCPCDKCTAERDRLNRQMLAFYNQGMSTRPLAERINPQHLSSMLREELANQGIQTDYNYGVFSKEENTFVIFNDHYVVDEEDVNSPLSGYRNIHQSKYRAYLFPEGASAPGLLMIYFPSRTSLVWSSLWKNFLGTILFTGLILFCFAYTINVIFRQKKLSEMKTDFINNMTHEFKTPIATISLAADSIGSPLVSSQADKVQRFANIIKQENRRMNSQVEKVLQMALIDKRDFSLNLTDVDLHDVIRHAIENISLQVEKKNGQATAHLQANQPIVEGDVTHLSNVINNLLDNANKYSPEEPDISITTRNVPNGVEVVVEDHGIGMTKEARKHIFDKFYRVHTGNLHDVKGFGLGLSYVKAIMTAHKGSIDVKSELGKGSSFVLFFPYHVNS